MSSGFRKDTTLENTVDFSQFFQEEGHHFTTSSNESVSHLELPSISQYVYTITGTLPNVKHYWNTQWMPSRWILRFIAMILRLMADISVTSAAVGVTL